MIPHPHAARSEQVEGRSTLKPLDSRAVALALLTSLIWGGNVIAVKVGLLDVPPFRLAWMRFILGGLSILAWAWITRSTLRIRPGERLILLSIALLFTAQLGLFHLGISLTTAGNTVVLLNVNPVHTVLLAHFFVPGDRLTARKLGSVLIGYAGVVLVFLPQLHGGGGSLTGDLLISVAAVLLAIRTIALNRLVQRVDAVKLLLAQAVVGILLFFLIDVLFEHNVGSQYTLSLAWALLYQGVLVSGFNFVVNLWLLQHYRPSTLAPFILTTPLFGIFLTWWVLGEPLTGSLLAGAVLVAGGIGLALLPGGKAPKSVAQSSR